MSSSDVAIKGYRLSSPAYSVGKDFIARVDIQAGQSVLDVGCGTGELTALLADNVGHRGRVLGADPDERKIALAKERFKDVTNLSFIQAGICQIPRGNDYDIVFSNNVFHWIADDELLRGLKMIQEHLMKPGAKLAAQMPLERSAFYNDLSVILPAYESRFHFRKSDECQRILEKALFKDITWDISGVCIPFEGREDFHDFWFYGSGGVVDIDEDRFKSVSWDKNSSDEFVFKRSLISLLARK